MFGWDDNYPKTFIDSETGDLTIVTNGVIIRDGNKKK